MRWVSSADDPRSIGGTPPPSPEPDSAADAETAIGAGGGTLARGSDRRHGRRSRRGLALFVASVVALVGVRACIAEPVRIQSESMRPTLRDGDWVLIDKLSSHWRPFVVGDVVTAIEPEAEQWIIKRIVAVAGQTVALDDGRLVIDGNVVHEPHVDTSLMAGRYYGPITVPPGHVFLLGDNRADSRDSRAFGPVPVDDLTGRLIGTLRSTGGQ